MDDIMDTKHNEDEIIGTINIYMEDLFIAFVREGIEINDTNIDMFFKNNPEFEQIMRDISYEMILDMIDTLVSESVNCVDNKN